MTDHRSFSQMNQIRQCGEAYRLERVERLPSRPSWPAIAGRVFHAASEDIDWAIWDESKGRELPASLLELANWRVEDEWAAQLAEQRAKGFEPEQFKQYGRQDGEYWRTTGLQKCLQAYIDWRLDNSSLKLFELEDGKPAIEVEFTIELDSVPIHGYIDRVFVNAWDALVIFDLKSGNKPKTDEQLGIYRHALRLRYPDLDFTWGAYVYGLKNGVAALAGPCDLTHWTPGKLASVYGTADSIIQQGLFLPNPSDFCFHCGLEPHCDFSQARM